MGIVISGGINNLKGTLSPTQYNLNRLIWCIVNVDAYKIITKSFYNDDKFLNKPFFDLTKKKLDLFIKTIILDETSEFCFICTYLSRFKNLKSEM